MLFSFALFCAVLSFGSMISNWSDAVIKTIDSIEHPANTNGDAARTAKARRGKVTQRTFKLRSQTFCGQELQQLLHKLSTDMGVLLWHSKVAMGPYALVIGDSYSTHVIPRMYDTGRNSTRVIKQFHSMSSSGCLPTIIPNQAFSNYGIPGTRPKIEKKCAMNAQRAIKALRLKPAKIVAVVSRWQDYMFQKSMYVTPKVEVPFLPLTDPMRRISSSLKEAVKLADQVKVIGVTPTPPKDTMDCLWKQIGEGKLSDRAREACPTRFPVRKQDLM